MRDIWFFIKKTIRFKWQLLLGLLLTITLTASTIALMTLSGWFISSAAFAGLTIATATAFNYLIPAGTIRFLALIRILSRYGERVINHDFTFKILTELRVWFYQCLIPLSPTRLMQKRSGDLLSQAVHDIDTLDHLYLRVLSPCVIAILITVFVSLFIGIYASKLAIITFTMFTLTMLATSSITFIRGKKIGQNLIDTMSSLRIETIDFFQGMIPLLFYFKRKERDNKVQAASQNLERAQKSAAKLKAMILGLMTFASGITLFITLIIGIPLVNNLTINGAQLAMILLCIIVSFEQLQSLPMAFLSFGKTQFAAKRLRNISQESPQIQFPKTIKTPPSGNFDLTLNKLNFEYPNRAKPVLNNLSLEIPSGSKIAITGPSGAGKSTLMHLIARAWDPTSGSICLGGLPLNQYTETALRQHIAIVPQRIHIFNATVQDNLTLMNKNISEDKLYEVLSLLDMSHTISKHPKGLKTHMGDFGKQFSGGQVRRIGIARALLTQAPVQIWDEPSTGLNHQLFESIWQNCQSILQNKTLILITHDNHIVKKANQTYILENGTFQTNSDILL